VRVRGPIQAPSQTALLPLRARLGLGHDHSTSDGPLPTENIFSFGSGPRRLWLRVRRRDRALIGFTPVPGFWFRRRGRFTDVDSVAQGQVKAGGHGQLRFSGFITARLCSTGSSTWYFFPKYGFHAEAAPGLATYVAGAGEPRSKALAQAHTAIGFGFILGVGYDFWLGDQWSLGLARALQLRRHDRQRRSRREFHAQLLRTRAVDHG